MKNYYPKIATIGALAFTAAICAAQQISVTINDQPVQFPEAQPQYVNGRVLVPLRGVFEQMGASVSWNEAAQAVTAQKGNKTIRLRIGSKTARVDDRPVQLDVPAEIIDGSTMVPIRFLSESLGAQVGWNEQSKVVMLTTHERQENTNRPMRIEGNHASAMQSGTVIPVVLNMTLMPGRTEDGTEFSATLSDSNQRYGALPRGTTVLGHLISSNRRAEGGLGTFVITFDRIKTPDGRSFAIDGSPLTLDSNNAQKNGNGMWTATTDASHIWMPNEKLIRGARFGIRLNRDLDLNKD
jgi:type IV secretory pathway VirB10-like protein